MGIAFLHGNGGASGSVPSLTIVGGTTRPAKAAQNMIWINTDVEITSYVLSATEPENPVEGMAWITIGNSGSVKMISPISDEWITVYPISAKQYVGGTLVDRATKSYQGGEWVGWWDGVSLYTKGDQCERITGGWKETYQEHAGTPPIFNNDHICIETDASHVSDLVTKNPVDLTGISKLQIYLEDVECSSHESSKLVLYISTQNDPATAGVVARTDFKTDYAELNVSAYNAPYYIAVSAGISVKCKITDIKWEVA